MSDAHQSRRSYARSGHWGAHISKNPKILPPLSPSKKKKCYSNINIVEIVSGVEMQGIDFFFFSFFPEYSHYPPEK